MSRRRCYGVMMVHHAMWVAVVMALVSAALIGSGFLFSAGAGIAAIGFSVFLWVMALSFVIFAYGFNSVTVLNMPLHSLGLRGDEIIITFESGEEQTVETASVRPYRIYPGGVVIPVEGAKAGFLWVPSGAFDNPDDMVKFLKLIYESNSKQKQEVLLHA